MDFINQGLNVFVLGPSDSGKSYLFKAIGIVACMGCRVVYNHCEELLKKLAMLKGMNYHKYQQRKKCTYGIDLLILNDFLRYTIFDDRKVKILFKILEKRSEMKVSTFICSQQEPAYWSFMILNDEVHSNVILKRVTKHYTVLIKS